MPGTNSVFNYELQKNSVLEGTYMLNIQACLFN